MLRTTTGDRERLSKVLIGAEPVQMTQRFDDLGVPATARGVHTERSEAKLKIAINRIDRPGRAGIHGEFL